MSSSRRPAREAALQALFEVELGKSNPPQAIENVVMETEVSHGQAEYMERLVNGVWRERDAIEETLRGYLKGYDFFRLAAVDRNILRIATFELLHIPEMPPAVTINEAVEIAKKYSTAESGRFVNGVLGRLLQDTPKADWDPRNAPKESFEQVVSSPAPEIEEEVVQADSQEGKDATRFGWVLRSDDDPEP